MANGMLLLLQILGDPELTAYSYAPLPSGRS
jgi:hypothetical protein